MAREMEKVFSPQGVEDRIYKNWEESGSFKPGYRSDAPTFCIMMPPPNITGQLHMGHALDTLPQDVLTRYHRMKGDDTLWVPGTDHASIATEVKVVEQLAKEGLKKDDLGRDKFLERAWQWKEEYGGRIVKQLRKLGASCDWSHERFTMDEGLNRAVTATFVDLYERGLIYRGERIINWCPECLTALSDAEVEYEEQDSHLWHIRYPAKDGGEGLIVATTRPETMLGDTGVAVNPNDERYTGLIGASLMLPIMNREIPIVADEYVEMEFGSGAVKMTPAHDPNDYEIAKRHNLTVLRVMNDDGTMNENAGKYQGFTRDDCRKAVVDELKALGLLVKIENYKHNVGACYRCHQIIEPIISTQWFVSMKPLVEAPIAAVRNGEIKFVPERFDKTYFNWMENIRDWCISRQLWWGHRIPAFHCQACGHITVSRIGATACEKCGGQVLQDEDVLDTWFSSGLWPFSTLGWPEDTADLARYYPTTVLSTGYDLIFFWVARMIVSGYAEMGDKPYSSVLVHGLVRDALGKKMSKSAGNGIDPLDIIEQYGADALRFSLALGVAPGNDVRFSIDKVEANRNFANKIWNASRFALMNLEDENYDISAVNLEPMDKWMLYRLKETIDGVSKNLDDMDLGMAAQKLYDFIWSEFCDWYIEMTKSRLNGDDASSKLAARATLHFTLVSALKMLHPYMPFITEEIFGYLPGCDGFIMMSDWPTLTIDDTFAADAERMEGVMEVIRSVRNLRAEMGAPPSRRAHLIALAREGWSAALNANASVFARLAGVSELTLITARDAAPEKAVGAITTPCEWFMPLGDLVDINKEIARLTKERERATLEIVRTQGMLNNAGFTAKAPAALIEKEREKLTKNEILLEDIDLRIEELKAFS